MKYETAEVARNFIQMNGFTKREQQVFYQMLRGRTKPDEIGRKLKISSFTATNHINHMIDKCETNSKAGMLVKFINYM